MVESHPGIYSWYNLKSEMKSTLLLALLVCVCFVVIEAGRGGHSRQARMGGHVGRYMQHSRLKRRHHMRFMKPAHQEYGRFTGGMRRAIGHRRRKPWQRPNIMSGCRSQCNETCAPAHRCKLACNDSCSSGRS